MRNLAAALVEWLLLCAGITVLALGCQHPRTPHTATVEQEHVEVYEQLRSGK